MLLTPAVTQCTDNSVFGAEKAEPFAFAISFKVYGDENCICLLSKRGIIAAISWLNGRVYLRDRPGDG
jgi:hypothetical protein